ncbi:MAG: TlpA family protein disulfide reductase [Acidobacteria bacterium]|nr:TlpA family protein disulfide reductase [Acidobacteriota bacterium]
MTRRELSAKISAMMLAGTTNIWAANPVRPAPAFTVSMLDGTKVPLSKYLGKVCIVEFLFTTCQHCQHTAEVLSRLNSEFGPKGFQPIGVAWNDGASLLVPDFIKQHRVNFPIGIGTREKVLEFLGYSMMTQTFVPQSAFIDKAGKIRYQSTPRVEENLHDEARMRTIIQELLKEPGGPVKGGAPTAAKK